MSKRSTLISIIALVVCGLIFSITLGSNVFSRIFNSEGSKIVTPSQQDIDDVDKDAPGVLANISGSDLEKVDVRRGVAIYKNVVYFIHNKTESEIRAELAKSNPTSTTEANSKNTSASTANNAQVKIDPNTFASSQLMSWSSQKGVEVVSDLTNVDQHPINRLSSILEGDNLVLAPCIPPTNIQISVCDTSKIYQFNLSTSKLALISDISTSNDKASASKELQKKYHFDDLGQPYWQGIRGGTIYGIKNNYTESSNGSNPVLNGYLVSTKDGVTEKALVVGTQLAKADLKINNKGFVLIEQSGTLKTSDTCLIEHRFLEVNPDKPSEQQKLSVRKLSLDDKGNWNDGRIRNDAEQKTWAQNCSNLAEFKGKSPEELLQFNADADLKIQALN